MSIVEDKECGRAGASGPAAAYYKHNDNNSNKIKMYMYMYNNNYNYMYKLSCDI